MEFEDITPVSDADRRLAEAKKLTLQPMHTNVAPDEEPSSVIASRHINEPAIANIPTDTEESASLVQPSKSAYTASTSSPAKNHRILLASLAVLTIGAAGVATIILV